MSPSQSAAEGQRVARDGETRNGAGLPQPRAERTGCRALAEILSEDVMPALLARYWAEVTRQREIEDAGSPHA